jgi:hypothetical protein
MGCEFGGGGAGLLHNNWLLCWLIINVSILIMTVWVNVLVYYLAWQTEKTVFATENKVCFLHPSFFGLCRAVWVAADLIVKQPRRCTTQLNTASHIIAVQIQVNRDLAKNERKRHCQSQLMMLLYVRKFFLQYVSVQMGHCQVIKIY